MPVVGAPSTTAQLILDPTSEDASNVQVELTDDNNYGLIAHSYPTPPLAAQWASSVSTEGARLASKRHENRTITITVEAVGLGALYDLEQKIAKLYREGGTLKRTDSDGREIIFDVLIMDGYEPQFDLTHHLGGVTTVTFSLICAPYGRGAKITLTPHTESTLPALIFTETIDGDIDALGELTITETVGTTRSVLIAGLESRYYTGASLLYDALQPSGASTSVTGVAGASAGNIVRNTALTTSFTTVALVNNITNVGTFRVLCRVKTPDTNTSGVSVRLSWSTDNRSTNNTNGTVALPFTLPGLGWVVADLGTVTLPPAVRGTKTSLLAVDALAASGGDDIDIDYLLLIPAEEWWADMQPGVRLNMTSVIDATSASVQNNVTSAYFDAPDRFEGNYLRIPVTGAEGNTIRFVVFLSNVGSNAAGNLIKATSATLAYWPRYLAVPDL